MQIPSSSQPKACSCIPSGTPRWTGACLATLRTRSTGLPQAFRGRSTSIPQAFHRRTASVPQAFHKRSTVDWYMYAQIAHEWAFVCHALLGYACKTHSSSQVCLYGHSSVGTNNGKNDSSKTAKVEERGQATSTYCPPDPHISMLGHSQLGGASEPNGKQKWEA